jgi:hypothetical protein
MRLSTFSALRRDLQQQPPRQAGQFPNKQKETYHVRRLDSILANKKWRILVDRGEVSKQTEQYLHKQTEARAYPARTAGQCPHQQTQSISC